MWLLYIEQFKASLRWHLRWNEMTYGASQNQKSERKAFQAEETSRDELGMF